jgi:hypothetical protein
MMEGGLMKFLAKGATDKIIEDADQKREALLKTFQVLFHITLITISRHGNLYLCRNICIYICRD